MDNEWDQFPDYAPQGQGDQDEFAQFPDYEPSPGSTKSDATLMETAKDVATQIPAKVNRALAGFAAFPKAVVEGTAQLLGADPDWTGRYLSTEQLGVPDPLSAAARYLTTEEMAPEAKTTAGQIAGGIAEVGTGAMLPGATAYKLSRMAQQVPRSAAPGFLRKTGEDILARPGAYAAGEATSAGTAGIALGSAREAGLGPEGQMYATMAGGLAPSAAFLAPSMAALRAGKTVAARTLPPEAADTVGNIAGQRAQRAYESLTAGQTDKATDAVKAQLQRELANVPPERIAEANALQSDVPGLRLTTAEATESPSLLQAQSQVGESMPPDMLAKELARRQGNRQALEQAQDRARPRAEYDPEFIVDQGRRRLESGRQSIANQEYVLRGRAEGLASEIEQGGAQIGARGREIRDELTAARQETKAQMRALADEGGLNDPSMAVDVSELKTRIQGAYRNTSALKYEGGQAALKEHPAIERIGDLADRQSVPALMELRSDLQGELSIALRNPQPGNAGARRGLTAAIREIDRFLGDLGGQVTDPNLAQRYQQFRQAYRTQYIDRFEKGTAYKATSQGQRGYRMEDEQVATAFFDSRNPAATRQYLDIFGGETPALESAALDSLYKAAVRNGEVSETAITAWLRRHREVLAHTPAIRRRVESYGDVVRAVGDDRISVNQRRDAIDSSRLSREINRITQGQATVEQVIDESMKNPQRMRDLIGSMPEHRPAFARAVWERTLAQGKALEFLNRNRKGLTTALGERRVNQMVRLLRGLEKMKLVGEPRSVMPTAQPGINKVQSMLNTGLNQISSRIFAAQSGRTSWRYVGTDIAGRILRGYSERQAGKILMEAMLDPELAAELTKVTAGRMRPERALKLHTYLVAAGLGPDRYEASGSGQGQGAKAAPKLRFAR